ncbi:aldo/keto reductase family protein [Luedemannella helvata]|uniref:Aldo/keto reductase family protein n=1 Tax=Luedemannella helvata TaxID=349315 RepID=A0ABN2KUV4_9ACTN
MEFRQLGGSDLTVSEIALGSWLTYGDRVDRETAVACVRRAYDLGITLFDTANVYGRGAAETLLGEALAGVDRASYRLATKLYFPMGRGELGLSATQVRRQCDASLSRLGTDYLDLYQCHRFDTVTPLAETMGALTELVQAGKVRHIGFSEWTAAQIEAAYALEGVERFVSSQPQYSILWRDPEAEIFPTCARLGVGHIVYSPLAQGLLTGKYRPGVAPPAHSRAAGRVTAGAMGRFAKAEAIETAERLRAVADAAGLPMARLALAWVLRQPGVAAAIVGASRPEQLDETAGAAGIRLDAATLAAIDAAVAGPAVADAR